MTDVVAPLVGPVPPTVCAVHDCDVRPSARGWCSAHYNRWRRHGHPTAGARRPAGPVLAWLDPTPMVALIDAYGGPERIADGADRRAYHRAKAAGTVSDVVADRLCCRWLKMPLENVYGTDWGQEVAA